MSDPVDAPAHILVVDDDTRLRDLLRRFLGQSGYMVSVAPDAAEARTQMAAVEFDLLIVDIMMPGEDGYSLTRAIRQQSDVPVLMLTAKGEQDDRVAGLETGADDYLGKPFDPRELLLRIQAILRRRQPRPIDVQSAVRHIRMGECSFDLQRRELVCCGSRVHLTTAEADLLVALALHSGEALPREDLADALGIEGGVRAVDVQVTRLRRKIEVDPRQPLYLQTVRGTGYCLRPD